MAIREGKWRCTNCGRVNRGSEMACPGCGATRDEKVQFFLEEEAPEIDEQALLERARSGADWLCEYCSTSNPPKEPRCKQCGAERGGAASRPTREIRPQPLLATPQLPTKGGGCGKWLVLLLLLATGFCATIGYFAFRKTEERVTVAGFEWERSIEVEAFRAVTEEAWEGEVPSGARPVSRSRAVHHTEKEQVGSEKVKVGTKDLGNGFFEDVYEDRPVYQERDVYREKVRYEIDKWVTDRTETARGEDQSPRWPSLSLRGREREGRRTERYVVLLQGGKAYRMELPEARFSQLQAGQSFTAVIRGGSRVIELR
jgi:hypothetical protein